MTNENIMQNAIYPITFSLCKITRMIDKQDSDTEKWVKKIKICYDNNDVANCFTVHYA